MPLATAVLHLWWALLLLSAPQGTVASFVAYRRPPTVAALAAASSGSRHLPSAGPVGSTRPYQPSSWIQGRRHGIPPRIVVAAASDGGVDSPGDNGDIAATAAVATPDFVSSPVLRQVYPALLANVATYGHPNIPLGTADGRRCKTLRRLAFEKKLSSQEVELLTELGFKFNSFEEVYEEADFDECLARLVAYEEDNQTGYQIPKKYEPDPELGAWVTLIRRIGRDKIEEERRAKLDAIGFAWVSTRKCGSSFMKNYRGIRDRLSEEGGQSAEEVLADEDVRKWLRAQKEAEAKGNLSEHRVGYLDELPGIDWRDI